MGFRDIIGLGPAVRALQRALQADQLAGAYLLVGQAGSGKTTLARAFAQAAACLSPERDPYDACGSCESCRRLAAGAQPEIVEISPAGDQTQIWQFWDRDNRPQGALQHALPFAPTIGRRRVFIVERADTLTEAAANSLLKVLEEPPPYALFVLLSPHPARMLPTILSRAQMVRVTPPSPDAAAAFLQERAGLAPPAAVRLASLTGGRIGAAITLAREPAAQQEIDAILDLAETIPAASPLRALRIGEGVRKLAGSIKALAGAEASGAAADDGGEGTPKEKAGRRQVGIVIEMLIAFYEDLLAASLAGAEARLRHEDRRARIAELAAGGSSRRWMADLEALLAARRRLDQNTGIPLLTDWLAMRLVGSGQWGPNSRPASAYRGGANG